MNRKRSFISLACPLSYAFCFRSVGNKNKKKKTQNDDDKKKRFTRMVESIKFINIMKVFNLGSFAPVFCYVQVFCFFFFHFNRFTNYFAINLSMILVECVCVRNKERTIETAALFPSVGQFES